MKAWASALALGAAVGLLAGASGASQAAELWIMTTMGPSTGVFEFAAGFEKATKNKVTVTFESGPALEQKLQDGRTP
jgi:ABC-type glycerol-3-phosphate transport system substrate-binding protein